VGEETRRVARITMRKDIVKEEGEIIGKRKE
jgi:hypothetical protein